MLTAVVTQVGEAFTVTLSTTPPTTPPAQETTTTQAASATTIDPNATPSTDGLVAKDGIAHATVETAAPGPSPIKPEVKELIWGGGAFIVFALVMRYIAFPKLKKGMDARYSGIRDDHEQADAARIAAKSDVAAYQTQLASAKAEAAATIDAARQQLEAKRTERIAAANVEIAALRASAAADNEAARAAVQSQIQGAVAEVSSSAITLAVGKAPDAALVSRVVDEVMSAGASR
ncbi:MAG: atpG [Ilumatobacteraceae bacterium]|nr:atpG [Ilumatobacteraceae bacterium]